MYPELDVEHMQRAVDCQAWMEEELRSCAVLGLEDHHVARVSEEFSKRGARDPFFDLEWQGNYLTQIDRLDITVVAESAHKETIAEWLHQAVRVGSFRFGGEGHQPIIFPIDDACPDTCIIGVNILFRAKQRRQVDLFGPFYMH